MTSTAISAVFVKRIIDRAWWDLSYVVQSHFSRELDDALQTELKYERAHRRMGARFTDGRAQYRLSPQYAAKLFVLRHVFEAPASVDLADLGGLRTAVTMCYILATRMRKVRPHNGDATMWDLFQDKVRETRYVHNKPSLMAGGCVDKLPSGVLARELIRRSTEPGQFSLRSGPMFMALDYAVDIAVH